MLFSEKYREVKSPATGNYKEKGSKFIAYVYPVYSQEDIKEKINYIKKKEKGANHYCYAYTLHPDKSAKRSNDDGEPNSTAGLPILKIIEKYDLTNTIIIVVRYFGGIKLGIPGLIRSYKLSAENAINHSTIITKTIKEIYQIIFEFIEMNNVMGLMKKYNTEIIKQEFQSNYTIIFAIPRSKSNQLISAIKKYNNLKIEYLKTK